MDEKNTFSFLELLNRFHRIFVKLLFMNFFSLHTKVSGQWFIKYLQSLGKVPIHSVIPIFHLRVYGKILQRKCSLPIFFVVILALHICTCRLCSQLDSDKKKSSLHPFLGSPSVNCQTLTGRGRFLISFKNSAKKSIKSHSDVLLFRHWYIIYDGKIWFEIENGQWNYWIFWEKIVWKFLTCKN